MSSIHSGIVGSVNQAAIQQSESARARDAQHNNAAQRSQLMKQLLEKHLHEVEDSTETNDERARIRDEEHNAQQQRRRHNQKEQQEQSERNLTDEIDLSSIDLPSTPPPIVRRSPDPSAPQLDVQA